MSFGEEYSSDYAYFIAGGSTLAVIKKYEADKENVKGMYADIAKEYGAKSVSGIGQHSYLVFSSPVEHPALELDETFQSGDHAYVPNTGTPEGRALQQKLEDIPDFDLGQAVFAKRLTGSEEVMTNPDNLQAYGYRNRHYDENSKVVAATYRKYGDTYVVSVPRTVHGIFNAASAKASKEERYDQAAGYTYEWWSPPDSTPVPYSKVIELAEKEKGEQLTQRTIMKKVASPRSK